MAVFRDIVSVQRQYQVFRIWMCCGLGYLFRDQLCVLHRCHLINCHLCRFGLFLGFFGNLGNVDLKVAFHSFKGGLVCGSLDRLSIVMISSFYKLV